MSLKVGPWRLPACMKFVSKPDAARLMVADSGRACSDLNAPRRNEFCLAVDLLATGQMQGDRRLQMLVNTCGERLLGIQVAQILTLTRYLAALSGIDRIDLEGRGLICSIASLIASALEPRRFRTLDALGLPTTLRYLLERGVPYENAQPLFCFGLLAVTDIPQLTDLLQGVRFEQPSRIVPAVAL